jgi:predicted O-methyltransferase YrrM
VSKFDEIWEEAAEDLRPSLTRWVGPMLYYFARLIEAKSTLEIGLGRGYTSFSLGLYAKHHDAKHIVLDKQINREGVAIEINEKYGLDISFVEGDATEFEWNEPIDLLFVDILGSHTDFMSIFTLFNPYIRTNGFIIVHDYFCFGYIRRAVEDSFRNSKFELLTIPFDGESRIRPELERPCGMAIVKKL